MSHVGCESQNRLGCMESFFWNQAFAVLEWKQWNTMNMVVFRFSFLSFRHVDTPLNLHPDFCILCIAVRGSSTSAERHKFRNRRWICARLKGSKAHRILGTRPSQTLWVVKVKKKKISASSESSESWESEFSLFSGAFDSNGKIQKRSLHSKKNNYSN